jgi:hypothetical protein
MTLDQREQLKIIYKAALNAQLDRWHAELAMEEILGQDLLGFTDHIVNAAVGYDPGDEVTDKLLDTMIGDCTSDGRRYDIQRSSERFDPAGKTLDDIILGGVK